MRTPRLLVALAASSLLLTMAADAGAEESPEATKIKPAGPTARWITLITGDRVLVRTQPGQPEQVVFAPARGSASAGAFTSRLDGHTMVIPSAAMPDIVVGRLDRALFDVTTLLSERYDDAHTKTLPVIVTYAGSPVTARNRAVQDKPAGARSTRLLPSIGARSVAVTKTSAPAFWASATEPTVKKIYLDRRVRAVLDQSVPQIDAPAAWQRGHTGRGVKVAVLDTGIDTDHPDLSGTVAESADFSGSPDTGDHVGHGTHVASTIAGSGAASQGKYRGVAPDATLLNGKVLDDFGFGSQSGIIAGMEWATARGAKVVSMSLGSAPTDGTDPLAQAVNTLSQQTGALFVVAAGNDGPASATVSSPGSADAALTVGAVERSDETAFFSSRGPRVGDNALKPEISGPGVGIVAARAAGTELGEPVGEHYVTASGTSMATPHVAGAAALLAQAEPDWTGDQLRSRLISTADPRDAVADQGAGRVDADQATDGSITVDQGEVEFGYLEWPHPNQQPITKTLTYHNTGTAPVTLDLSADIPGGPAPRFSASQLVVPAGGQAAVDVTVDPAAGSLGSHAGRIIATPAGGGDPLVSTFGWYFEEERYQVTIRGIDRDGSAPNALLLISRPDGGSTIGLSPDGTPMRNGQATVRVAPGVIDVSTFFVSPDTDTAPAGFTMAAAPEIRVTGDTTVTLDARLAVPVSTEVRDRPGLTPREQMAGYARTRADGQPSARYLVQTIAPPVRFFAVPTAPVTVGDMEFSAGTRLEVPPFRARSLGAGGATIPVADLGWAPRFTGVRDLVAVDAGTGSPEDLADDRVRGKLAIIRHDPFASWVDDILLAAQQAGAAAVMLFNPDAPGIAGADGAVLGDGLTMPTLRTSRVAASELLGLMETRPVMVRITGVAATPVVYDLLVPWRGRVPARPRHVTEADDLARLDETFGGHFPGMKVSEVRFGLTPLIAQSGTGWLSPPIAGPYRRTSYLSPGPITWDGIVIPNVRGDGGFGFYSAAPRSYRPGERKTMRWFVPVANSGLPDTDRFWTEVAHRESWLNACFSPLDNGPDHMESIAEGTHLLTFKRNGELIGSIDTNCASAETPHDAAEYELSLDVQRERPWWKYSTRVRSTWTFRSTGSPDEERMPVILADLDVPSASALSQVKVGKPTRIDLGLRHQKGSPGSRFTSAKLEISYDGNTWTELSLAPAGTNRYTAVVTHPVGQAGKAVHLRLDVQDENGGRLTQEVTRAYGLTN